MSYQPSGILDKLTRLPWVMIAIIIFISMTGFVMMYSASGGNIHPWASRQLLHFAIFLPVMLIIAIVDIRIWFRISYLAYFAMLLLLVYVFVSGHTAMGATRWINLGIFKLQPSELMKICLVLALARYFHVNRYKNITTTRYLIVPALIVLVPVLLIIKQPDLGTGMILLMVGGSIFFLSGIQWWKFAAALSLILLSCPIAWRFLHDYQKNRILMFLNPESDPLGSGYNIIQSKIAIGSGGFYGKGLIKGSQSQLSFLPEHQTDFIFTMLSEELGFIGGITMIILYSLLLIYGIFIAANCRSQYGRLLASGVTAIFFLHVFINMGMVMGIMPVVGAPLPLLTYGGTIMMTMLTGFGFILNVHLSHDTIISQNSKTLF